MLTASISYSYYTMFQSQFFAHIPQDEPFILEMPLVFQLPIRTWMYTVVEESCWDFASQHIPHILRQMQWTEPAAVEVKQWLGLFLRGSSSALLAPHFDYSSFSSVHDRARMANNTFETIRELRNSTAHRRPWTVNTMLSGSMAAGDLMRLFRDRRRERFFVDLDCRLNNWKLWHQKMLETSRVDLKDVLMDKRGVPRHQNYFCKLKQLPLRLGEVEASKALKTREDAKQAQGKILFREVRKLLKDTGSLAGGSLCCEYYEALNTDQNERIRLLQAENEQFQKQLAIYERTTEETDAASETLNSDQNEKIRLLQAQKDILQKQLAIYQRIVDLTSGSNTTPIVEGGTKNTCHLPSPSRKRTKDNGESISEPSALSSPSRKRARNEDGTQESEPRIKRSKISHLWNGFAIFFGG